MNTLPLVYVITLNWNHCDDTLTFLASASRLIYPHYRILVVDNGSKDGSALTIATNYPSVKQITNGRNLGFAAGVNVGIRHAMAHGAEWVWLTNNDTFLAADALNLLVKAALTLDADMAATKILYANGPERIWSMGGWRSHVTLEITSFRRRSSNAQAEENPFEVDFITACGMLIRRRCLEKVGLLDERFFMYYEDSDYCLRAQATGCRAFIVPQARMWHRVAASIGGSDSLDERYYMALSSVRFFFFRKHVHGWRWLVVAPYRIGSAVKTTFRLIAHHRFAALKAYWRGLRDGLLKDMHSSHEQIPGGGAVLQG